LIQLTVSSIQRRQRNTPVVSCPARRENVYYLIFLHDTSSLIERPLSNGITQATRNLASSFERTTERLGLIICVKHRRRVHHHNPSPSRPSLQQQQLEPLKPHFLPLLTLLQPELKIRHSAAQRCNCAHIAKRAADNTWNEPSCILDLHRAMPLPR
jgi:hypothetical protein